MKVVLDAKEIAAAISNYLQTTHPQYDFCIVTLFTEKRQGKQEWGAEVRLEKGEAKNGN